MSKIFNDNEIVESGVLSFERLRRPVSPQRVERSSKHLATVPKFFAYLAVSAFFLFSGGLSFAVASNAVTVNAAAYGQSIWDGSHDVSQSIQSAINAVAALGGGVVDIPQGQWEIGASIKLASNVSLIGAGAGATLAPTSGNNGSSVLLNAYLAQNVRVENLTFDGGGSNFTNSKPVIAITSSQNVVFNNIVVQNTHGIGLLIQGGTSQSGVTNVAYCVVPGSSIFSDGPTVGS